MVRTVAADSLIEKYLENLYENEEFSYGIIVGQVMGESTERSIYLFLNKIITVYRPHD